MNCPLCESNKLRFLSDVKDVEYWTSDDIFSYYECLSCQLIFLKDPPTDRLNEIYPDTYYSNEFEIQSRFSIIRVLEKVKFFLDKKFFRKALSSLEDRNNLSCLDIGGGSGWMLDVLRSADNRVRHTSIIDLNPNSREIAERNGHVFYCQNIESVKFRNQFDVVLMFNLIEHIAVPKRALEAIYGAMLPGALAIIKTPNTRSLNRKIFEAKYWGGFHAPRHWMLFNEKNFRMICEEAGFIVQKLSYTQGAPQWAASLLGTYFPNEEKKLIMNKTLLFPFLMLLFAIFDFVLLPLRRTDQIFVELRKKS